MGLPTEWTQQNTNQQMEQQAGNSKTQINKWNICQEINQPEARRRTRIEKLKEA